MKNILIIFFLFLCYNVVAQQRFPTGPPTQFSTGYFKQGYHQSDSGTIIANRDTNWLAKYSATVVFKPSNKQFYWFDSTTLTWNKFGNVIDTTPLHNQIVLKLNIADTANMLLPYLRKADTTNKWVQEIYVRNDSLFKFKNGTETFVDTLNGGGGGSGLTSVGLSMPSAFSVSGSPLTSNGTINVSGAGTTSQYIRGNGTLATTDTGMISNFYLKVRSLFSGTSPITFNQTTGVIGINNANASGTKGAASFTGAFSDNGSGLIDLADLVSAGSCTNCSITFNAKGRATAYSNGTASGITSLNGLTASVQVFAFGSSGITPNFSSSVGTHTLNIPLANGAGVTSGTITKTEYDLFSNKLDGVQNIGTGFRWYGGLTGATANVKTVYSSNTIIWDSISNSNGLTPKADTSVLATQFDLSQLKQFPDSVYQFILNNAINSAEQTVNQQSYKWASISTNPRTQWYDGVSAAVVQDTLIMFGGWNTGISYDSVFQSGDGGVTWTFRSNLPYAVHTPAYVPNSSDGYTYIIGGDYLSPSADRAKVYRTKDFRTYELRTSASPFGTRVLHAATEFNGALYCGGGQKYTLAVVDSLFKDLYKSTDGGITWSLISDTLSFMGKNISGCFHTFDERMYIISGGKYDTSIIGKTFDKSVYYSSNGINWRRGNDIPVVGMQYPNEYVWDGKLWIVGGFNGINLDSTCFMDKSGNWHKYVPTTVPSANHAAATLVWKDNAYRILGNVTNEIWRIARDSAIYFEADKTIFNTDIAFKRIRRNDDGYNIDAYSQTGNNEDRYTNNAAINKELWSSDTKDFYNGGTTITWHFPASGQLNTSYLLASGASGVGSFYTGAYYSTYLQTSANFPGLSMLGNAHRLVLGLDGSLFGFRLEDGATNGIRFKHDISNGKTVIAQNTTNNYDVATVASATLALLSTTSGFLPPAMSAAQKTAISSPATGLQVFDTDSARASIYNGSTWKMVAWTSDIPSVGNTLYTGDGTLAGNRTVTGSSNSLTFNTIFNYRINSNSFILDNSSANHAYTFAQGAGNALLIGYTPTATVYDKGYGLSIDTNNNVGLATNVPTTAPLYTDGSSSYATGFQSARANFYRVDSVATNTTVNNQEYFFVINASGGNVTMTLPLASTVFGSGIGVDYVFKRIDNSGNTVTVQVNGGGSDLIDGASSFTIVGQYTVKEVIAGSVTNWWVK